MEIITSGYTRKCKDSLGGLDNIYLFTFNKYSRSQIVVNNNVLLSFPQTTYFNYAFNFSANFDNKMEEDAGGKYYNESLTFSLPKIDVDYNLRKFLKQDLRAIVRDRNGKLRLLGAYNGLECDGIKATTGNAKNSFNGYEITLSGKEERESLYINNLEDAGFTDATTFYRITQSGDIRELTNNNLRVTQNG